MPSVTHVARPHRVARVKVLSDANTPTICATAQRVRGLGFADGSEIHEMVVFRPAFVA